MFLKPSRKSNAHRFRPFIYIYFWYRAISISISSNLFHVKSIWNIQHITGRPLAQIL